MIEVGSSWNWLFYGLSVEAKLNSLHKWNKLFY